MNGICRLANRPGESPNKAWIPFVLVAFSLSLMRWQLRKWDSSVSTLIVTVAAIILDGNNQRSMHFWRPSRSQTRQNGTKASRDWSKITTRGPPWWSSLPTDNCWFTTLTPLWQTIFKYQQRGTFRSMTYCYRHLTRRKTVSLICQIYKTRVYSSKWWYFVAVV